MSKKLSGNGLWESSRMMLPEHKEQLLAVRHDAERQTKPLLDEQAHAYNFLRIVEAMAQGTTVHLTVFDQYDTARTVEGIVAQIDEAKQRILLIDETDEIWVPWEEIMQVD